MIRKIKGSVIKMLGSQGMNEIQYFLGSKYYKDFEQYKNKKKIIYFLTPTHGNMGDQAIAFATEKFLKDNFKDYEILEIYRDDVYRYSKVIKRILNKDDLIFMHGGGNMGNLYKLEEEPRRFIIKKFKNNKIISMTQTITFTDDEEGRKELQKTKEMYNQNKNLTLLAREDKSFENMTEIFKNIKVIKVPDIVFYLENMNLDKENKRTMITTCLRNDKESYIGDRKSKFIEQLKNKYDNIYIYDTAINKNVYKENREVELKDMWNKFMNSKLVITDRLHGMIFSVITGTPCIVFRSLDHKVIESYKWIESFNHIQLVDSLDINKIEPLIDKFLKLNNVSNSCFKEKYFKNLINEL